MNVYIVKVSDSHNVLNSFSNNFKYFLFVLRLIQKPFIKVTSEGNIVTINLEAIDITKPRYMDVLIQIRF